MAEHIKSPLNYTGGKFKLLPQILPLFPNDIDDFVDLFGGGANVLVNVKANSYVYNDLDKNVHDLIKWITKTDTVSALQQIDSLIITYDLSKTNKLGYLNLRNDYNDGMFDASSPVSPQAALYTLICYSFNNQIRFNSKGKYNMPFGKDRSSFNPSLRSKFIHFSERISSLENLYICSKDYKDIHIGSGTNSFIYCDPPYLLTTATYNERDGWNPENESDLLAYLDDLDTHGWRFALSNVTHHGSRTNDLLLNFAKKYTTHELSMTYSNASYQKKDKTSTSREVLITNY